MPFLCFSLLVLASVFSVGDFPSRFLDSLQEATLGSVRKQNITLIILSQERFLLNSGVSNRVVCYQILTNFLLALALCGVVGHPVMPEIAFPLQPDSIR